MPQREHGTVPLKPTVPPEVPTVDWWPRSATQLALAVLSVTLGSYRLPFETPRRGYLGPWSCGGCKVVNEAFPQGLWSGEEGAVCGVLWAIVSGISFTFISWLTTARPVKSWAGRTDGRTNERTNERTDERAVSTRRTWTLTTARVKNNRKVWTENRKVCSRLLSSLLDSKPVFHSGNFESNLTLPQYSRKVSAKWINTRTWGSRRASLSRTWTCTKHQEMVCFAREEM